MKGGRINLLNLKKKAIGYESEIHSPVGHRVMTSSSFTRSNTAQVRSWMAEEACSGVTLENAKYAYIYLENPLTSGGISW